jgi:hypothetical protein
MKQNTLGKESSTQHDGGVGVKQEDRRDYGGKRL